MNSTYSKNAFTLVELLVVVGIIAILIAFLMPTLNKARAQAQKTQCMSNLRQFGIGEQLYANDWKGTVVGNAVSISPAWTRRLGTYQYFMNINLGLASDNATLGRVKPVLAKKMACPTCPNTADSFTITLSYGAQDWVLLSTTKSASEVMFAGDTWANPEGSSNGSTTYLYWESLIPATPPHIWFGHQGDANFLMADGHVESMAQKQVPVANDVGSRRYPGFTVFWQGLRFHS